MIRRMVSQYDQTLTLVGHGWSVKDFCSDMLDVIEGYGMLPPPNHNLLGEFVDILEWEDEDESM